MIFEESWRWYGPHDPISLSQIRQAGASGIVNALHQIPVGALWSVEEIQRRIDLIEKENSTSTPLKWIVVESLPVHEDIKQGKENRDELIEIYCQSIRNLARCGVRVICYNFMPVLDWLRTNVRKELPNGSTALYFHPLDLIIFDLYILKRPEATKSYDAVDIKKAQERYSNYTDQDISLLKESILMALPGDVKGFTLEKLKLGLEAYAHIDENQLRANLIYFLERVIPVAAQEGVCMAIHPDDPPWSVFGLPRVVGSQSDLEYIFSAVPDVHNGLTYCTGSLGAHQSNDLKELLLNFEERIHFVHLRSTQRNKDGSFFEANHLEGDAGLVELITIFYEISNRRQKQGKTALPMRPDHGHQMLDDLDKQYYPGYSAIGRLKGLAELRGVASAITHLKQQYNS